MKIVDTDTPRFEDIAESQQGHRDEQIENDLNGSIQRDLNSNQGDKGNHSDDQARSIEDPLNLPENAE